MTILGYIGDIIMQFLGLLAGVFIGVFIGLVVWGFFH